MFYLKTIRELKKRVAVLENDSRYFNSMIKDLVEKNEQQEWKKNNPPAYKRGEVITGTHIGPLKIEDVVLSVATHIGGTDPYGGEIEPSEWYGLTDKNHLLDIFGRKSKYSWNYSVTSKTDNSKIMSEETLQSLINIDNNIKEV